MAAVGSGLAFAFTPSSEVIASHDGEGACLSHACLKGRRFSFSQCIDVACRNRAVRHMVYKLG